MRILKTKTYIVEKIKTFAKAFWQFISSGIFLKNFLGMIGSVVLFFFLTSWWLTCYTDHGDSIQVQDFKGMKFDEAKAKAEKMSFNLVINDSIFLADKEPNIIIDQHPKPLTAVKENRTIYLKVTKSTPPQIPLPALVGNYDYVQYSKKIIRKGVKAQIVKRVYDAKQAENTILYLIINDKKVSEDDLQAGVTVPEGSTVNFVVTERGGSFVPMPNLVCMKLEEAKFVLENYNLNIGEIIKDKSVSSKNSAYIWKQEPAYNSDDKIRIGTQINLYLKKERPDGCNFN